MILPNLLPSQGPIDFLAAYDKESNFLHISFRDPATWCQTHSITLKCKNPQMAVRWLYRDLGAVFNGEGLSALWAGGGAAGTADGNHVVPATMALAANTILTADIQTIWFTGSHEPFETRQYSLELLQLNNPSVQASNPLLLALENAFLSVQFPQCSVTELILIRSEYGLISGHQNGRITSLIALKEMFDSHSEDTETGIVQELEILEQVLNQYLKDIEANYLQFRSIFAPCEAVPEGRISKEI